MALFCGIMAAKNLLNLRSKINYDKATITSDLLGFNAEHDDKLIIERR